ncbi:cyclophilin-like fold protein [Moorella sulfitireducens]|uniref:cyclophilin-like fold protein n=1 Tax=Neomoorella sulfitireducens TaxID=2972948 RepID=UPI0021AC8682|nr:cyclophilin-like fold protein [Moorella sulfitireducens]
MQIAINFGKLTVIAELNDSDTARKIQAALPITGRANTWGDEIYFSIPVKAGLEEGATADMEVGDIAYWPPGHAFCLFFGPTPASTGAKPRAASPVNKIGRILSDPGVLKKVPDGARVEIHAANER